MFLTRRHCFRGQYFGKGVGGIIAAAGQAVHSGAGSGYRSCSGRWHRVVQGRGYHRCQSLLQRSVAIVVVGGIERVVAPGIAAVHSASLLPIGIFRSNYKTSRRTLSSWWKTFLKSAFTARPLTPNTEQQRKFTKFLDYVSLRLPRNTRQRDDQLPRHTIQLRRGVRLAEQRPLSLVTCVHPHGR